MIRQLHDAALRKKRFAVSKTSELLPILLIFLLNCLHFNKNPISLQKFKKKNSYAIRSDYFAGYSRDSIATCRRKCGLCMIV